MKYFLGPILGAEVAQKRAPFPAVVTRTEMGNANLHKNLRFLRPSNKKGTVFLEEIYVYYVMLSRKLSDVCFHYFDSRASLISSLISSRDIS